MSQIFQSFLLVIYAITLPPHLPLAVNKNIGGRKLDKRRRENIEEVVLISSKPSNNGQSSRISGNTGVNPKQALTY